jgi:hypothetical protein
MQITKRLRVFMATFTRADDMVVLTRVEHGTRTYWLANANEAIPAGARRLGTVAEVRAAL